MDKEKLESIEFLKKSAKESNITDSNSMNDMEEIFVNAPYKKIKYDEKTLKELNQSNKIVEEDIHTAYLNSMTDIVAIFNKPAKNVQSLRDKFLNNNNKSNKPANK